MRSAADPRWERTLTCPACGQELAPLQGDAPEDEPVRLRRELATAYAELEATVAELEEASEELRLVNEEVEATAGSLRECSADAARAAAVTAALLDRAGEAIVVLDGDLRVRAWSRGSADLWGLAPEEAEGARLVELDIALPVAELARPLRRALAGEPELTVEVHARDRGGRLVRCAVEIHPLGGGAQGALLVARAGLHGHDR